MQVHLEPEEYRKLIELAYLGEWLINAHHDTDFQDDSAGAALQRLLETGREEVDGIERDAETGEYFMQADWVEQLYDQYIMDYDDHVFWDELTERLAARDLARSRGVSPDDVNRDDDILELRPLEDVYRRELEEHGIEHLELQDGF